MKNWKIGTRISAGFAAIIVIAMTFGFFAYTRIGVINRSSVEITGDCLPSAYMAGQIQSNVQRTMNLLLQHAIANDKPEMDRVDGEIRDLRANTQEWLAKYEKLLSADEDRRLFAELVSARNAFWAAGDEVLRISRLGTAEAKKRADGAYTSAAAARETAGSCRPRDCV
jgi:CHASE3 domain sensor protein